MAHSIIRFATSVLDYITITFFGRACPTPVDGGPKIITFIGNGVLCGGSGFRQFGWGHFSPLLRDVNSSAPLRIAPALQGQIHRIRVYDRYLRTSEAVGSFRAGL